MFIITYFKNLFLWFFFNKIIFWVIIITIWIIISYFWYNIRNENIELEKLKNEIILWDINNINKNYDNKFLYFTWTVNIKNNIQDDKFYVNRKSISIERKVEMYQWKEKIYTKNHNNNNEINYNIENNTTYEYIKIWSNEKINSNNFNNKSKKNQVDWKYENQTLINDSVYLWNHKLNKDIISWFWENKTIDIDKKNILKFKIKNKGINFIIENWYIYIWTWNLLNPNIWDLRISFIEKNIKDITILWTTKNWEITTFISPSNKKYLYKKTWVYDLNYFLIEIINNNNSISKIFSYIRILTFTIWIFMIIYYFITKLRNEDELY